MNLRHLQRSPFRLDARALAWVAETFGRLSPRERRAQLVVPLCLDGSPENLDRLAALGVGGLFRAIGRPLAELRAEAERLRRASAVPPLLCGDLEFGERDAIGGDEGTALPNQLAAAAAGGRAVERMARVAAIEGRAAGFDWSFTPVADLEWNFHNPVVNTRSFGDDPARVARAVRTYITAMQRAGMAACVKHWPGDGVDDRDQHYVTSVNSLPLAAWDRTYGRIYRAAIRAGVLSVMSAHIALPAWPGAGDGPASRSQALNLGLLRGRLGFNGLIVSDACGMGGLTATGGPETLVPGMIAAGCDMVLFPADVELELDHLARAVASGRLSEERVAEAVLRVLALKAALGLHHRTKLPPRLPAATRKRHARWMRDSAAQALTLVRDDAGLLPLSSRRQRRVLLIESGPRRNLFGPLPALQMARLLEDAGFTVGRLAEDTEVSLERFDVAIYAVAEEGGACKTSLKLRWDELHGGAVRGMMRVWRELPTVFVSFGNPWHVREVTGCPTYVNAYSPVPAVQAAVVQALMGRIRFRGTSPVDLARASSPAEPGSGSAHRNSSCRFEPRAVRAAARSRMKASASS